MSDFLPSNPPYRSALTASLAVQRELASSIFGIPVNDVPDWVDAMDRAMQAAADQQGHGDIHRIEEELAPLEQSLGMDVAYHEAFNKEFPLFVALLPLHSLEQDLAHRCKGLQLDPAKDYRYLVDLLTEAELPDELPEAIVYRYAVQLGEYPAAPRRAQRLARAIEWLNREREQAPLTVLPMTPPPASTPALPDAWAGVLAGGCSAAHLVRVLQRAGLLANDGRTPTPEAKPGAWIGAVTALREKGLLTRRNHAAVARALHQAFGDVVSERMLQRGYQPDNELHSRFYTRTLAFSGA